jgi:SAM-dependent methyltransferase
MATKTVAASAPAPPPSFTPERLEKIRRMEDTHFWFAGRRMLVDRLIDRLHLNPATTQILDLGTGGGATARRLNARGYRVTAADFLPEGLRGLQRESPGVLTVQSSAEILGLPSNHYDVVMLLDVIEHIDDRLALSEALRVLKPGGSAIITVPAYAWLWSYRDEAAGHKRRYAKKHLRDTIQDAGFTVNFLGFYQCFLLPVVAVNRLVRPNDAQARDAEDAPPAWLNRILTGIARAEVAIGKFIRWPAGSSLAAVARKP